MRINEVILQTIVRVVFFIILTLAFYLFFSGHNAPGGGFVSGLVFAAAFVLLCLAFDIETVKNGIPINFKYVAATGALIATLSGVGSVFFDAHFLTQTFGSLHLPFFGEVEVATVTIFESGVSLAVVGVVVTIILSISEDV